RNPVQNTKRLAMNATVGLSSGEKKCLLKNSASTHRDSNKIWYANCSQPGTLVAVRGGRFQILLPSEQRQRGVQLIVGHLGGRDAPLILLSTPSTSRLRARCSSKPMIILDGEHLGTGIRV